MKKSIIRLICLILLLLIVGSTLISCSENEMNRLKFSVFNRLKFSDFNRREFIFDKTAEEIIAVFGAPDYTEYHCDHYKTDHILDESGNCIEIEKFIIYYLGYEIEFFDDVIDKNYLYIRFDKETGKAYSIISTDNSGYPYLFHY